MKVYSNAIRKKSQYLPVDYAFVTSDHDFEAYFIHSLNWARILARKEKSDFVPMQSTIMQAKCPSYRKVINELVDAGIVEIFKVKGVESYEKGIISKQYRLNPKLWGTKFKRHTSKTIWQPETKYKAPIHKVLFKWLQQLTITENHNEMSLMAIEDKKFFLTPCDYNRVHTNLTNLQTELRNCLRFKSKQLVQFDFINSQPTFLALLSYCSIYSTDIYDKESYQSNYLQTIPSLSPEYLQSVIPCHYVSYNLDKSIAHKDLGLFEFISDCCSGKLYERIGETLHLDRKTVKRHIWKTFFAPNKYTWEKTTDEEMVRLRFSNLYPSVYNLITDIKRKDYRHLAHSLQRLEGRVVIHQICPAIVAYNPKIPIWTIHDSVLTTEEYADEVEAIIQQELNKLIFKPKIKKELL